jgi:hypothetical protein
MDDYEPYDGDTLAWSWSYLRHPRVLLPWLACAALSAVLRDGRARPHESAPAAAAAPAPPRPLVLSVHAHTAQQPPRSAHDDEARAA